MREGVLARSDSVDAVDQTETHRAVTAQVTDTGDTKRGVIGVNRRVSVTASVLTRTTRYHCQVVCFRE